MGPRRAFIVGASCFVPAAVALAGAGAPLAAVEPALTISRGDDVVLDYSLPELAALPQTVIITENEFMDGKLAYRGPLVERVLEPLSLDPSVMLLFTAANDFAVQIPFSDILKYHPILALEVEGKPLSLRDKGPLWLMYPISDNAALRDPVYLGRLIWQLVRIDILAP